jgi:hypothetical protein
LVLLLAFSTTAFAAWTGDDNVEFQQSLSVGAWTGTNIHVPDIDLEEEESSIPVCVARIKAAARGQSVTDVVFTLESLPTSTAYLHFEFMSELPNGNFRIEIEINGSIIDVRKQNPVYVCQPGYLSYENTISVTVSFNKELDLRMTVSLSLEP